MGRGEKKEVGGGKKGGRRKTSREEKIVIRIHRGTLDMVSGGKVVGVSLGGKEAQ